MNQLPLKLSAWLSNKQVIIEIVLAVVVGFACILKFLYYLPGADEALMITMLTLAAFYFLAGFIHSTESQLIQIPTKIYSIASSVCVIGLLFALLHLPGATEQLMIGLLSLAVSGVAMIFLMITSRMQKFIQILIRLAVLGGLSLNAFMTLNANSAQ
jgi:hypothetical protein